MSKLAEKVETRGTHISCGVSSCQVGIGLSPGVGACVSLGMSGILEGRIERSPDRES